MVYVPLAKPEIVKLPEGFDEVVPDAAPLKVMVAPLAPGPVIVPEIEYAPGELVKVMPVTFALLIVTPWLVGLNAEPALLGVTVYEPLIRVENVKLPEESAIVEADAVPLRAMVAPFPPAPLMFPDMEYVAP